MSTSRIIEVLSNSPEETQRLGERLGHQLAIGDVVLLHGDLGAGKTALTQGIAVGLGVRDYVQSPTFTLVAEHEGESLKLYHLDLYRLDDAGALESLGFDQYLEMIDGVSVIEWPERAGRWLPDDFLLIELAFAGEDKRLLRLECRGAIEINLGELVFSEQSRTNTD